MGAIKIQIQKAVGEHDLGASKFFGDPVLPSAWVDMFSDDVIFFAQLRLADIAELDEENRLPHTGYMYFFIDTEMYPYQAIVYLYDGEPDTVIDGFNEVEPRFAHLDTDFLMSFEQADCDADGIKLFGTPSSGVDAENGLLLQFDPLAADTGFLDDIDGYAYFFFGEDERNPDEISFVIDRS